MKNDWLTEERETYVLGLLRVGVSVLLFLQTGRRALELYRGGYFGDFFHVPLLPDSLVPSAPLYATLLALALLGSALSALGIAARPALFGAALIGLYCLLCDRLQYHNNRYQLLLLSALVAVTPCDRSFLLGRPARPGPGPRWAVTLVAAQVSLVYLASGLGKLLDPDWRGGTVMLLRFGVGRAFLAPYTPSPFLDLLSATWFAELASVVAIATELFLALGLWSHRTRALALWLGVLFHLGVEIAATVELFSYTMLCGYLAFVTPELRERSLSWDTTRPWGRRLFKLFQRLDLLARFEHGSQPSRTASNGLVMTTDREGRAHHRLAAWRELARAMPPVFPLWLPLRLLSRRSTRKQPPGVMSSAASEEI